MQTRHGSLRKEAWLAHLEQLGITAMKMQPDPMWVATEGALWGSIRAYDLRRETLIVSDDAGQLNVGQHALCWIHAERMEHRPDTFTEKNRAIHRPHAAAVLAVLRCAQSLPALPGRRPPS